jgi:hypothetical protein
MKEHCFKIGDLVYGKAGIADCFLSAKVGELRVPNAAVVLEQLTQTCCGGTQYHYVISPMRGSRYHVAEIELVAANEFDVDKVVEVWLKNVRSAKHEST